MRAAFLAVCRGAAVLAAGVAAVLAVVVAALVVLAWVTAAPGDPRLFPPAAGAPTVEVAIVDHGYHAGLVVRTADLAAAGADGLPPSRRSRRASVPIRGSRSAGAMVTSTGSRRDCRT